MRAARAAFGLLLAGPWAAAPARAQSDAPATPGETLSIVEPESDALVSGKQPLRAVLSPDGLFAQLRRLTFMADGRHVCTIDAAPLECAWDAGPGVQAHEVRAVAVLKDGRRLAASVRTRGGFALSGAEVDLVHVTATVTDGKGRLMKMLPRGIFQVQEDGVGQEVTHFVGESQEREIVVAVDISGSMGAAMPQVRQAVRKFLAALRPSDHVTLLAFNDSVFTLARRETDAAARSRAVDRLASWGGTCLHDAILRGLDLLDRQRGLKALVVFTDGEDRSSRADPAAVARRVGTSDALIYMIGQGRGTEVPALKKVMDRLAGLSGGRAFHTKNAAELEGSFAEIVEELSSQYVLAYEPTNGARDGSWREIRVGVTRPGLVVRSRQGYRAPLAAAPAEPNGR
jgi:VWFA-related protein